MPASNKPYRRFDENGNRQYAPNRQGFYDKYPEYRGKRLQNPKDHPDGPYTEAGNAFERWYTQQNPNRFTKTKAPKTKAKNSRMAGDAFNAVAGAAPIYNGPNSRDFSRTLQDEEDEKRLNQYGDPIDTAYLGGSPFFNERTGQYEPYTGSDGVTRTRDEVYGKSNKGLTRRNNKPSTNAFSDLYGNVRNTSRFVI